MAYPVSHIVYAKRYFEKYPSKSIDMDEFILGCCFPDIRYIEPTVKRQDTHLKFYPLDLDFSGLTSFQAGWKFHLYCDMRREEILNEKKFYALNKHVNDFYHVSNKLLEDEVIYREYNNWEKIVTYFDNAPRINLELPVGGETFALWYSIVAKYVSSQPDSKSMKIFLSKLDKVSEKSKDIIKSVDILRKDKKVANILKNVMNEII